MNVEDRLTPTCTAIDYHPETPFLKAQIPRHLYYRFLDPPQHLLIPFLKVKQGGDMFLGNKQKMYRCHRIYILKRQEVVILVDHIGRDFSVDNTAKQTTLQLSTSSRRCTSP